MACSNPSCPNCSRASTGAAVRRAFIAAPAPPPQNYVWQWADSTKVPADVAAAAWYFYTTPTAVMLQPMSTAAATSQRPGNDKTIVSTVDGNKYLISWQMNTMTSQWQPAIYVWTIAPTVPAPAPAAKRTFGGG